MLDDEQIAQLKEAFIIFDQGKFKNKLKHFQ